MDLCINQEKRKRGEYTVPRLSVLMAFIYPPKNH